MNYKVMNVTVLSETIKLPFIWFRGIVMPMACNNL